MIGSLNKIWPWKKVLSTRIDRHGDEVAVEAKSILPSNFDGDPQVLYAVTFAIVGFALILLLERAAGKKKVYAD
jgi:putative membrane protein